jgi:hypothetical protein
MSGGGGIPFLLLYLLHDMFSQQIGLPRDPEKVLFKHIQVFHLHILGNGFYGTDLAVNRFMFRLDIVALIEIVQQRDEIGRAFFAAAFADLLLGVVDKKVKGSLRLGFFSTEGAQAGARGTARFDGKLDMFHTKVSFIV